MEKSDNGNTLRREVGLFSATVLVVANMIGTGVFTTSGFVMGELGSAPLLLLVWAAGGIFALAGAFCYAELGAMFPKSGGDYVFLRESFGRTPAFLSGWVSLIVGFSAPVAAASIAFVGYFFGSASWTSAEWALVEVGGMRLLSLTPGSLLACVVVVLFTIVHTRGMGLSTKVQNVLTAFKFVLIAAFILAGLFFGSGDAGNFNAVTEGFSASAAGIASALVFVSFAYSGWNAAAYIGGEIKRPERNLPAALLIGTGLVTVLYLLVNAVYLYALKPAEMTGVVEVGAKSATVLFGGAAGGAFSIAVAVGLLSVVSAMILAGPRVYFAMAKDGVFFEFFGRVDPLRSSPARAVVLQCAVSIAMILTTAFDTLLIYIGVLLSVSSIATVAGMVLMRVRRPDQLRPYRCFAYPLMPIAFIAGNLLIVGFSLWSRPVVVMYAALTLFAGVAVLTISRRARRSDEVTQVADPGRDLPKPCPVEVE